MVTFNISPNGKNIVGSINTKTFSTPYTQAKWDQLKLGAAELSQATTIDKAKSVIAKLEGLVINNKETAMEEITPFIQYDDKLNRYYLKYDNKVSSVPLPESLIDRLKYAHDNNLPSEPLIKFIIRAFRSPRFYNADPVEATVFLERLTSYVLKTYVCPNLTKTFMEEGNYGLEVAREMATVFQTPITAEGLISTRKVIRPLIDMQRYKFVLDDEGKAKKVLRNTKGVDRTIDEDTGEVKVSDPEFAEDWRFEPAIMGKSGDAFYCGDTLGHIIRIGEIMYLPEWTQVNMNDYQSCQKGIHTGGYDYVRSWMNDSLALSCAFVDPRHVGAISMGDPGGVLRVKQLTTHGLLNPDITTRQLYHSSTYAGMSDDAWDKERADAIKAHEEARDKVLADYQKQIDKLNC